LSVPAANYQWALDFSRFCGSHQTSGGNFGQPFNQRRIAIWCARALHAFRNRPLLQPFSPAGFIKVAASSEFTLLSLLEIFRLEDNRRAIAHFRRELVRLGDHHRAR
jgi:hypothetical protein